jgi:hypothetical protein
MSTEEKRTYVPYCTSVSSLAYIDILYLLYLVMTRACASVSALKTHKWIDVSPLDYLIFFAFASFLCSNLMINEANKQVRIE